MKCLDVVSKTYDIDKDELLALVEHETKLELLEENVKPVKNKGEEGDSSASSTPRQPRIKPMPRSQCCALYKNTKTKAIVQCTRKTTGEYCYVHESTRKYGTVERL